MTTHLSPVQIVESTSELEKILRAEIDSTEKEVIEIFAGHMPARYEDDTTQERRAYLDTNRWGEFTTHTFELGCKSAAYAIRQGKCSAVTLTKLESVILFANNEFLFFF